jgi:hypothetical protein
MLLKNKIFFWVLTVLLLVFSVIYFEGPSKDDGRAAFFGDVGDGFFNIWILEHNYQNVLHGDFDLFDGRIFQPEAGEDTLIWSDNLFVPTIFYSGFRTFFNPLTSSFYTGLLLSFLSYISYVLLFFLIYRIVNDYHKPLPEFSVFFIPFFAFMTSFSVSKLEYYSHFQMLSSCFVVLLIACMIGTFFYGKKLFFSGMLFCEVILMYSTPYLAVLGMCFILSWFIVQVTVDWRALFANIKNNILSIIIAGGLFSFLSFHYMRVEKIDYGMWVFRIYRATFDELFIPQRGLFYSFFKKLDISKTIESSVYLGIGVVLGIIVLLLTVFLPYVIKFIKKNYKNFKLYIFIAVLICYRIFLMPIRNSNVVALIGMFLLCGTLVVIFAKLIDRNVKQSTNNMFAILILAAIFCYGIAFGPNKYFMENNFNPSVWGVIYKIIPGASSIRAIVPAQGLLISILFASVLILIANRKLLTKRITIGVVSLCVILQIVESTTVRASITYRFPEMVESTEDEIVFFQAHPGLYLFTPTTPWHKNSRGMIYFAKFTEISLMNGYSAKNTDLWDRIMRTEEKDGVLSQSVIDIAAEKGCDYIVVAKTSIPKYSYRRHIKPLNLEVVFNNDRFVVLSL